jgi:thioredoxin
MKKFGFILMITTVILIGCGSSTGGSNDATVNTVAVENGDENKGKGDSKPLLLDQESFKKLVMNYEKNPKQWVFEGDKPCIVDFYADWCKPCRMIAPILEELAVEYEGQINIYKVDTQKERELASVFGITSLPTVLFVPASGNPSAQKGALPKESYKQIIDEFLLNKKKTN